jgi:hypothetical protein
MTEVETQQSSSANTEHVPPAAEEDGEKHANADVDLMLEPATRNVDSLAMNELLDGTDVLALSPSYEAYHNADNDRADAASESTVCADSPEPSARTAAETPSR